MPALQVAKLRHAEHYRQRLDELAAEMSGRRAEFERDRPQIEAAQAWASVQRDVDADAALLCAQFGAAAPALCEAWLPIAEYADWLESALAVAPAMQPGPWLVECLSQLARLRVSVGEYESALPLYDRALAFASSKREEARILGSFSFALACAGDKHEAIRIGERALDFALADGPERPDLIGVYTRDGVEIGDQALALARQQDDPELASIRSQLAKAFAKAGDHVRANELLVQTLPAINAEGDDREITYHAMGLSDSYLALGQVGVALEHAVRGRRTAHALGDRDLEGLLLLRMASALVRAERAVEAITALVEAIDLFREERRADHEQIALEQLASAAKMAGRDDLEAEAYDAWLAVGRQGSNLDYARAIFNQAVARWADDPSKLAAACEHALALVREPDRGARKPHWWEDSVQARAEYRDQLAAEDRLRLAIATEDRLRLAILDTLAAALSDAGEFNRGFERWREALEVARRVGAAGFQVDILRRLGHGYDAAGRHEDARQSYLEAIELVRGLGDMANEADLLGEVGNAYFAEGDPSTALDWYQMALDIDRTNRFETDAMKVLAQIGEALLQLDQLDEAERHLEEALHLAERHNALVAEAWIRVKLGFVLRAKGELKPARDQVEAGLALFQAHEPRTYLALRDEVTF
jgi:tetratricopeptide (TPR) repeat protein